MSILWWLLSAPIGFWHLWYFRKKKDLSESELVKISRKFRGINRNYTVFSLLAIVYLIFFPSLFFSSGWNEWVTLEFGIKLSPVPFVIFAGYGLYQGLFALTNDVYPMAKSMTYVYVYDDVSMIHRIAKYQILIAVATDVIIALLVMTN